MYSTLVSLALIAATFVGQAVAEIDIATPAEIVQCQDVKVTWGKGVPPFDLIVASAKNPCDSVLVDLGDDHKSNSLTWKANLKAGTEVVLSLLDSTGEEGWTGSVTVKPSNDFSCLAAADQPKNTTATPSSSRPASSAPATTLVVPNNVGKAPPTTAPGSSPSGAVPVGAANAGLNPTSGASVSHAFSGLTVAFSVAAAAVLASL
ncbi:hypothetical protein BXZ70DRAFT_1010732 [Cristinia sonorae]|uniref:Uncharacterized protein n=1 Tax=Cristinia sonorae TaxID=1940300 RepID=A0A8K0XMR6_9AGAR|nr:hypothetical protein BXZ70DRAFT_1010732 [Cristinia sonorae]